MGYIKTLNSNPDPQSFPGATFAAKDTIPKTQCTQALVRGDNAISHTAPSELLDPGAFTGLNLQNKICHITQSTGGNTGNFLIVTNNSALLLLASDPGNGTNVHYYVTDGEPLEEQQTTESLFNSLQSAGYAATIKAGILYTNAPNQIMSEQCLILWSPLT